MINYFYDYIRNIILFLIFTSFIKVVLPNSKYSSYINLIFGMILIFIMIRPINYIFNNISSIDSLNIFNNQEFEVNTNINVEKYKNIQNQIVKSAFKENVKSQIENMLKNKYFITEINLDLYENKYEEINIEKIYVTLNASNTNIYIKPFNEAKDKEIDDIKKLISNFYNLTIDNIFITIA